MGILRLLTVAVTFAIAVFALGHVNPSFAHKTSEKHNHGDGGNEPPSPVEGCNRTAEGFCIASVGKWHGRVASEYASAGGGTYTEISSNGFGKILDGLPDDGADKNFQPLCDLYDVLIFEWDSPNIKNLDWDSLVNYMACGGGVIWEDTTNIVKLTAGVAIDDIRNHDKTAPSFFMITFDFACIGASRTLCAVLPNGNPFLIVNNHIVFSGDQPAPQLLPFLIHDLPGEVLGLYGVFGNDNGGCIVLTGPDNNFHGNTDFIGPNKDAPINQHALLTQELDWLLLSSDCTPPPP